jgi:antitoxin component YwqK of YwqJK toxin-antitoxin module
VDKSGTPVTGTIEHLFGNKKVFMKIESENGKQNQMTMYYPNGKKRIHDDGRVLSSYHVDGTLANEVFRSSDMIVLEKIYHPNGKLSQEIPYQNGYVGGTVQFYDMDGDLMEERSYKSVARKTEKNPVVDVLRHGTAKVYLPNKNVMSETYENGVLKQIGYHDKDGKELKIIKLKVGALAVDTWRAISADYNKACELKKDEKFSGLMLLEDTQGLLQMTCQDNKLNGWVRELVHVQPWLTSHTPYKDGKKHGVRIEYGAQDLLIAGLIPYKKDVVDGTVYSFVPTNRLNKEVPFKKGKPHGLVKTYAISNNQDSGHVVIMEEPMKDGKLNGIVKIYNKMGNVIAERVFKDGVEKTLEKKEEKAKKTDKKKTKSSAKSDKKPDKKTDKKSTEKKTADSKDKKSK